MKRWDEYYLVFDKSERSSSSREVLLNGGESLSLYQFNADLTLRCGCMPKSLGQINLIEMNSIRTVNKLSCFIQRLVNTDGSPESHEITFVDRVRFSQNKMYLLQNDISWGLERMSDHEIYRVIYTIEITIYRWFVILNVQIMIYRNQTWIQDFSHT